jgi:zinc and cadmium transporter
MNLTLVYSLIVLLVAWGASAFAIYRHREDKSRLRWMISFGAGVLLGAALLHLLPHAFEDAPETASWWVLFGFLFFYLLEVCTFSHACEEGDCDTHALGLAACLGLGVHNFSNGVALGAGAAIPVVGWSVLAATVAHKAPEFLTLSSLLLAGGRGKRQALLLSMAVAFAVPLGAFSANWFMTRAGEGVLAASLAFSAGMFIHIAATDLAPEIHRARKNRASHVIAFLLGLAAMAVVALSEHSCGG